MSAAAPAGGPLASALATLRRVRRRLEHEAAREAGFLESFVSRVVRTRPRPQVGSSPLPAPGKREDR